MLVPHLICHSAGYKTFFFDAVKSRNKPDSWHCASAELILTSYCAASNILPTASFSSLFYASSLQSFSISYSKLFLVLSWKLAL